MAEETRLPLTAEMRDKLRKKYSDCGDGDVIRLLEDLEAAERDRDDLQAGFELRWEADQRAIKRWQEETGRTMWWPDHTDLLVWLMAKIGKNETDE